MKINKIAVLLLAVALSACGVKGNSGQQQSEPTEPTSRKATVEKKSTSNDMSGHPGKKVYNSVCLACHMADGSGVPGMHPPLIDTDWVTGDKERLIKITLEGLSGKIKVKGEVYNSLMPPHSHLSDKQIADVLTYIRKSFSNNASGVTKEEVQKVRNDS